MKKLMIAMAAAMVGAANAAATYTYAYEAFVQKYAEKDTGSADHTNLYRYYGMTQDTARDLLGTDQAVTYADVSKWLGKNFTENSAAVVDKAQALNAYSFFLGTQYVYSSLGGQWFFGAEERNDTIGVVFFDNGNADDSAYNVLSTNGSQPYFYFLDGYASEECIGTSSSTGWIAVAPEPTSGLLMLLGMAGLALKRRRA